MRTKSVYVIVVLLALSSHSAYGWSLSLSKKDAASPAGGLWSTVTSNAAAMRDKAVSVVTEGKEAVINKVGSMLPAGVPSTKDVLQGASSIKDKVGSVWTTVIPSTNDVWLTAVGLKEKGLTMLPKGISTLPVVTEGAWEAIISRGEEAHAAATDAALTMVQNAERKRAEAIAELYSKVGSASNTIWKHYGELQKITESNIEAGKQMGIKNMENAKKYIQENHEALKSMLKGILKNPNVIAAIRALNIMDPDSLIRDPRVLDALLLFTPPLVAASVKLANPDATKTLEANGVTPELLNQMIIANGKSTQGIAKAAKFLAFTGAAFKATEAIKEEVEKGKGKSVKNQ